MLFTTPEQFVVLGVLLIGGWLLGYATAPSTKKWKRRVREQSDSFTAYHAEAEDRVRAANQKASDLQGELQAARTDRAEAERTIAALRAAAVAVPVAAVVAEPPALSEIAPEPTPEIVAEPVAAVVAEPPVPAVVEPEPAPEIVAEPVAAVVSEPPVPAVVAPEPEIVAEPVAAVVAEPPMPSEIVPEPAQEIVAEPISAEIRPTAETHAEPTAVDPVPALVPAAAVITEPVHAEAVAAEPSAPESTAESATVTAPEPPEPAPVAAETVPDPAAPVPMTPAATEAPPAPIGPAEPEMPGTGWFASSARDALTRIRGIDDGLNARLAELGVVRFEDIEMLSGEDEMALEQRLALPVGSIGRDQWRTQAALLRAGQNDEHAAHFAPVTPAPVG